MSVPPLAWWKAFLRLCGILLEGQQLYAVGRWFRLSRYETEVIVRLRLRCALLFRCIEYPAVSSALVDSDFARVTYLSVSF